ncbi:MAG: methyltransferase domain-containing protein [Rhizonema sp. PD38]|nr:methyltransferase domain-containing protein [Rhizonema sp. PD38]
MPEANFLINPRVILRDLRDPKMYMRAFQVIKNFIFRQDIPLVTNDRRILEQKIIPYFLDKQEFTKVLFVGCGSYTRHYEKWFKHKQEYWTIDINPFNKIFGAKKHIVDSSSNLNLYFKENYLDLIICNGVFGHGLDEREDVDKAYGACYQCLRNGGVLIIGWNDDAEPFPLNTSESIKKFKPFIFTPLSNSSSQISIAQYMNVTDGSESHVYNFYIK